MYDIYLIKYVVPLRKINLILSYLKDMGENVKIINIPKNLLTDSPTIINVFLKQKEI